ncbi:MAG: GNAT family N-acetyltransferase [Pseudomonadota bacterium]
MTTHKPTIDRFQPDNADALLGLTLRAWSPVFDKMAQEMPPYIFSAFYPDGWKKRQYDDVKAMLTDGLTDVFLAWDGQKLCGYVGLRYHPEDNMGEIVIIAVDPDYQRKGIADRLMDFSFSWMSEKGASMAMVETGGDAGHAPARAAYESVGFKQLPIARYFREL